MKRIYAWNWVAHTADGKRFGGHSEGRYIPTQEVLLANLMAAFSNLDYSQFTCKREIPQC